jgi:hypothetical protein
LINQAVYLNVFRRIKDNNYGWVNCGGRTIPPGGGVATLTVPVRIYDSTGKE